MLFEFDLDGKSNWKAVEATVKQQEHFEVQLPADSFADGNYYGVSLRARYKDDLTRPVTRSAHTEAAFVHIDNTLPSFKSVSVRVDGDTLKAAGTVVGPAGEELVDPIDAVKVAWGGSNFRELDAKLETTGKTGGPNEWRFSLETPLTSVKDLLLTPQVMAITQAKVSKSSAPRFFNSHGLIDVDLQVDGASATGKTVTKRAGDKFSLAIVISMKAGMPQYNINIEMSNGVSSDESQKINVDDNTIKLNERWDAGGTLAQANDLKQGSEFTINVPLMINPTAKSGKEDEEIKISVVDPKHNTLQGSLSYILQVHL
ncbi:hypothetical protein [Nitratireductor thuwali]|uniref:Uncharacterized protein n=1 Tax=Nitratireductor thuwali TaxID=2267699 RepID=A0ABY5MER5_9HYPH|nr:hypothetical protein NTH_00985 [Nitratireductor thuwali]